MKWELQVEGTPQEVIDKLRSAIDSIGGFSFIVEPIEEHPTKFKLHKPIKYPDQILHRNRIIVNATLTKSDPKKATLIAITFTQHWIMSLTIFSMLISWLAAAVLIVRMDDSRAMYFLGGGLIGVGIGLYIAAQKKFKKDTQDYKSLFSKIFETHNDNKFINSV